MLNKNVEVSVLMSAYNSENFIEDAIESILNQTYINFEFIIVDDGSTDKTLSIIKSFKDKRIKLIQNSKNLGLTKSLNIGLEIAEGKYVARMDADDICKLDRLFLQLNFLKNNPDVGVLGTDITFINETGKKFESVAKLKKLKTRNLISYFINKQKPKTHNLCVWYLLFKNCFYHPTVMFNKEIIINSGGYKARRSEDLDLWIRLYNKTKFANLKTPLLYHRIHSNQTSLDRSLNEFNERIEARQRIFSFIFDKNINLDLIKLLSLRSKKSNDQLKFSLDFLDKTYINFKKKYSLSFIEKLQIRIDYIRLSSIMSQNFSLFRILNSILKLVIINLKNKL